MCQCHGKTHPAALLARIKEGPFIGSPLGTHAVAQVGSGGTFTNFMVAMLVPGCTVISCACTEAATKRMTASYEVCSGDPRNCFTLPAIVAPNLDATTKTSRPLLRQRPKGRPALSVARGSARSFFRLQRSWHSEDSRARYSSADNRNRDTPCCLSTGLFSYLEKPRSDLLPSLT